MYRGCGTGCFGSSHSPGQFVCQLNAFVVKAVEPFRGWCGRRTDNVRPSVNDQQTKPMPSPAGLQPGPSTSTTPLKVIPFVRQTAFAGGTCVGDLLDL